MKPRYKRARRKGDYVIVAALWATGVYWAVVHPPLTPLVLAVNLALTFVLLRYPV